MPHGAFWTLFSFCRGLGERVSRQVGQNVAGGSEWGKWGGVDTRADASDITRMNANTGEQAAADDDHLESITQCARALGCGRTTIYKLLDEGRLRSVHVGRKRMIPRGERRRLVREQMQQPTEG